MKFYTKFNPPVSKEQNVGEGSMTCQEFKYECDINNIVTMPNYGINPLNPPTRVPSFGDFADQNIQDFQKAQNVIAEATQLFEALPSQIRERFSNDPAKLIDFVNNQDNYDEAKKLGMLNVPFDELPLGNLTPTQVTGSPQVEAVASSGGSDEVRS